MVLAAVSVCSAGCATNHKTAGRPAGAPAPLETATKQQLIALYNDQAKAIRSLNASIAMKLTAGTAYSGVIKQYHEVKGFLIAQKPASIRVIGQAPIVGTTIFDMASDGQTFHVYIPSKNKFLEGQVNLPRASAQPIENLRPQHLTEAMFWTTIAEDAPVLFEAGDESEARYYILTLVRGGMGRGAGGAAHAGADDAREVRKPTAYELVTGRIKPGPDEDRTPSPSKEDDWTIDRKVWFDRLDLSVARLQAFDSSGNVTSDVRYGKWDSFGTVRFARQIEVTRPAEDYALEIGITKLSANEPISADKFDLKQPEGTDLVRVGEDSKEPKP
jgi:hypothetical protein